LTRLLTPYAFAMTLKNRIRYYRPKL
jgi:hypothetical protein